MIRKVMVSLVFVLIVGFASAAITLNEPSSVYNLGDRLYVSVSGIIGADSGNLNIDLICGSLTSNLVRISARAFDKAKEQTYSVPYKILNKADLEIDDVSKLIGTCRVVASMGSQTVSTKDFTVTNKVSISGTLDSPDYNPGDQIQLTINAQRGDLAPFNGFFQVTGATEISGVIENGAAIQIFSMPGDVKADAYTLNLVAYDQDTNGILNKGETSINFLINRVATSLVASISEVEVTPEKDLILGAEILDQSGEKMNDSVNLKVISPSLNESETTFSSGEFATFNFPSYTEPGMWKAVFTASNLVVEKEFKILEFQKAEFDITDSILTITNVGNTRYSKVVEIKIGEDIQKIENLNIPLDGSKQFKLKAPKGEYEIIVSDGETSVNERTLLTGRAISVKDLESVGIFSDYSIIWVFLIIIIGATASILFLRHKKTKTISHHSSHDGGFFSKLFHSKSNTAPNSYKSGVQNSLIFTNKSPAANSLDSKLHHVEDDSMVDLANMGTSGAESALVMKGEKHRSAVISISIKNSAALNDNAKEELARIINKAKISKGLIDWRGSHIFVIFSPLITRTYGNEILAARAGLKMLEDLTNYNKRFKDKIEFNIGVHAGDLIASKEDNKLKYTGIGNTIALAKRISDTDSEKMLVSEEIRKKMLRDMRSVKAYEIAKYPIYSVTGLRNKEADKAKLKDLLDRMEKG